jgi:hypothetical protein
MIVRKIVLICFGLWLCLMAGRAETFQLNDGRSVSGEPLWSTATDTELTIRVGDGEYQKITWTSFSQDDLKKFQSNPKLASFVEPFIEIPQSEKIRRTEVDIKPVPRLDLPPHRSLFGAMFSTGLGTVVLLLLYVANLYAAYEIAVFRARPRVMVCGLSALLPVVGPIVFLSMPTLIEHTGEEEDAGSAAPAAAPGNAAAQAAAAAQSKASAIPDSDPLAPDPTKSPKARTSGLHLAHADPAAAAAAAALPPTQTFQRGAFTFNRRFFETKFPGFFGVIRRDAEKDMVLVIKSVRGEYVGTRISRITGADFHLEVHKGNASEEVLIPFTEIKEIKLQHKDAP